jgi:hypothetical protein
MTTFDQDTKETIADQYRIFVPTALEYLEKALDISCDALSMGMGATLDTFTPTAVQKTKFITHSLPFAMQKAANEFGFEYKFVDAVGYDSKFTIIKKGTKDVLVIVPVEEKASTMDENGSAATFATGNCYSQVKTHLHYVMRLVNEGNTFTKIFGALVDPSMFKDPISGWKKSGKGNSGFDTLRVSIKDFDSVIPIFGEVLPYGKKGGKVKYCQVGYESLV